MGDPTHSEAVTRGIRVEAQSFYVPARSSERDGLFFFSYQVRISNLGSESAQLISREWVITDGNGQTQRVVGPGVVGEQPVLQPGASFEYQSFCPLSTPVGSMHGCYHMVSAGGENFEATIAPFTLAVPTAVN
ncbi:MAG: Co2+/Mg2+ efflux protein ApaG [Thermoanaerobaculia bacterium]